ncbi:MAG: filamentous hemagglutinin N-terminal domain-containing protein, partial [Parvibaculaceae bacterium]|nr:filamentous hemagglutinin N-terminal domain-containing protein [Parvibaculaceae bacterium]
MAANNSLARVTRALQAMQTFQQSQRNLSLGSASTIPPGLAAGGLQVAAGAVPGSSLWRGADAPVQQGGANGTRVDIHQTASQAILNWETFNVSKETTVVFDQQGQASWVALNRVQDPSGAPSRILGQIRADGSVYLINRNGVVFGGSSQVNTHALVASSADIADAQFLANGIYASQSGASYVAGFTGAVGAVDVEAGAQITTNAPQSVTDGGGFVLLMGSSVHNAGTITTPKGQTQLAAGDDFIIRPGYGTQTNQASTTRGNEIAPVVHAGSGSGSVTNSGLIFAQQGDITLAGHAVEQGGLLLSTTSVNQRGTIHLLNAASDATGSVTVTGEGVSAVLPELESPDTALNSQRDALIAASGSNGLATGQFDNLGTLADRLDEGRIEIVTGGTAEFQTGSLTQAQGGQVAVSAGARIFTRNGATIDVSGVRGVSLAMASNQIEVNIQGNELRDSPANRDAGYLPNQDVWIDARNLVLVPAGTGGYASDRYYTGGGLLEVGGYLSNTAHTIGEWASVGGSITLSAPQVVAQQGSVFNISGGSLAYQGGYIQTSNFLGSDGHLYNVGDAPADMLFYGVGQGFVRRHERWGITEVWMSPLGRGAASIAWQDGYTVGRDAGSLILSTPTSLFEGTIEADVVTGIEQTGARPSGVSDGYRLTQETAPLPGTLALGQYGGFGLIGAQPTDVRFGDIAAVTDGLDLATPLPGDRSGTAWFDADTLNEAHLGGLNIASAQTISVDAPLRLADGAQVTFAAPDITINAGLTAHGGDVTMGNLMHAVLGQGQNEQWWALNNPAGTSQVTINGTVDLTGLWVNGIANPDDLSGVAFLDGGSLTVSTTGGITLAGTGAIDVSSGGAILANGKTQGGKGGDVSLITNDYSHLPDSTFYNATRDARLVLDGAIRAYGFNGGGTLTLGAGQTVVIGEDASLAGVTLAANTPASTSLILDQDFVIPAGGTMPFDYAVVNNATPVDVPLPTTITITIVAGSPLVTSADWVVPAGMYMYANGVYSPAGVRVPAGATISSMSSIPAGTIIPSSVFPKGIPVPATVVAAYKAGDIVTVPVTLPSGMIVPVGAAFDQAVAIRPVLALDPALFRSGFTDYAISSNTGMSVGGDVDLAPVVPVYRFNEASYGAPGGTSTAEAAELWLPPIYQEDPVKGQLTQRTGADLTLSSLYDFNMQVGASIAVDPGHNVTIYANRQTTVDGGIIAPGGNILITSLQDQPGDSRYGGGYGDSTLTRSIWIGDDAALDAAAQAVTAKDWRGKSYGLVPDGGSITLGGTGGVDVDGIPVASDAFIVVRPGALLDASGTSATLDVISGATATPTMVASDGGAINLYSAAGIYLDGRFRAAAGGTGASGGTLGIDIADHVYGVAPANAEAGYNVGGIPDTGGIPGAIQTLRNITIVQDSTGSGLADDLTPGAADQALQFGKAVIGVDQIHDGGFDSLALYSRDLFVFDSDVNLAMARSITLSGGIISASPEKPGIAVNLAAPYVRFDGWDGTNTITTAYYPGFNTYRGSSLTTADDSSLTVSADLIDLSGVLYFGAHGHQGNGYISYTDANHYVLDPNANDLYLTSGSDIVDAPGFNNITLKSSGDVRFGNGSLVTSGDLTIQAGQIYPLSNALMIVTAGQTLGLSAYGGIGSATFNPDAVLAIRSNGGAIPGMPASVFGKLSLVAPMIDQGGVVRAPLGVLGFDNNFGPTVGMPAVSKAVFRTGSLTSTSAAGLIMPFGGTSDGVTYQGIGTLNDLGSSVINVNGFTLPETGMMINATSVVGEAGAVLDLSGGGDLTGTGFVSGRGGSVDTLKTPLINSNPAYASVSAAGNQVYAIMPGAPAYAPVIATNGAGDPAIGRQITIPAGVPGLPAGTYTLLPSSYALLPGAFRIELGQTGITAMAPVNWQNGSYAATGYLGIANTGIKDALPTQLVVAPGAAVRTYSQYNETNYVDFATSQAAVFGAVRPRLPQDGGVLEFNLGAPSDGSSALSFAGTARFNGVNDGIDGTLIFQSSVYPNSVIDITAPGATPVAGHTSISSDDINAFDATTLIIGGTTTYYSGDTYGGGSRIYFTGYSTVNIHDGATLRAGQVFLTGSSINVDGGATIDTRGLGSNGIDSTLGYAYGNTSSEVASPTGPAVLAVANGWFNFLPVIGTGSINVDSGASFLTEGSIVMAAAGSLTMGDVDFGARYLTVTQNQINAGTDAALAAAQTAGVLPAGWNLTQSVLDKLLHPSATAGVPALEELTLTAGGAVNLFGSVLLDARSQNPDEAVQLVINTPAIYGAGNDGDTASITADTFVWNGIRTGNGSTGTGGVPYGSRPPSAIVPGGAGTGSGTLAIDAGKIEFGYDDHSRPTDGATLDRIALGFSSVNLSAGTITANSDGTLSVGESRDRDGKLQGGDLTLSTGLLTGENGSSMSYTAGGAVRIATPSGAASTDTSTVTDMGGTVAFSADSIFLDTAVALPSGQLTLSASHDVALGDNAKVDLAGRGLPIFDVTIYSWGGDLVLSSAQGDITQAAGSVIDVSAINNDAGSITASAVDAAHGRVLLGGTLKGSATGGSKGGRIGIAAQTMGDFAAFNESLNTAGFFGARSFDLKQGDLVIGNEVKAQSVSISLDNGSLTVNGTIDASGATPGTIQLGAKGNLTLASTAVLDTHGNVLQVDSYGAPVEADNTAHVDLTTTQGTITLVSGATIDMTAPDGVARGKLSINAPRLGTTGASATGADAPANATGGDIAISAAGPLNIRGAASIAVNAFASYANAPVDPDDANGQIINQAWLDLVDQDSNAFIDAAYGGNAAGGVLTAGLQGKLAGLTAYGGAFHLRPGVEVRSATADGNLTVAGNLDLSGYRYGPGANPAIRGSGEPGVLAIRAGGNLDINGSINDGFAPPPNSPDDAGWIVTQAGLHTGLQTSDTTLSQGIVLGAGSIFPVDSVLGYSIPILGSSVLAAGAPASKSFNLPQNVTLPAGWVLGAAISLPYSYAPGSTLTTTVMSLYKDVVLQADWYIAPGSPEGNYFDSLGGIDVLDSNGVYQSYYPRSGDTIPKGWILPGGDNYTGLPAGFVVPANVFPDGIPAGVKVNPAGTTLASSVTLAAGTAIPVGFTLPQDVVTETGASLKANTTIPVQITLGSSVTVNTPFTATGTIVTPGQTFNIGDIIPAGTTLPYGTTISAGNTLPFTAPITSMIWPSGDPLIFTSGVKTTSDVDLTAGNVLPTGSTIFGAGGNAATLTGAGQNWAVAPMLAPGSQSWSMTLVSGADLSAANTHILQMSADLDGTGNLTLYDPHYMTPQLTKPLPSVIRTGTGDLEIFAGGNYEQQSPFGVYTAGTAIAETGTAANDPYNLDRGTLSDGTIFGAANSAYEAALNDQRMYYTEHGGDFMLVAQGDISGDLISDSSTNIGDWLLRQGGAELGQATAWGISFGSYAADSAYGGPFMRLSAFSGMGALGGGDVTLKAGGDIGDTGHGVVVAVGGSGRVMADDSLVQTGGGTLSVTAGGNIGGG